MEVLRELGRRHVETLYVEAMLLADDAQEAFIRPHAIPFDADPGLATLAACEQMRVTTRLMHVVAWLLTRRAVAKGEIDEATAREPGRALGRMPVSDLSAVEALPGEIQIIVHASIGLFERVASLEHAIRALPNDGRGPANDLQDQLRRRYTA